MIPVYQHLDQVKLIYSEKKNQQSGFLWRRLGVTEKGHGVTEMSYI